MIDLARSVRIGAFALCLLLATPLVWESFALGKIAHDFSVYFRTANNPAELAYAWRGDGPFPYAPTMLLWVAPLSLVGKWPAFTLLALLSLAALAAACRPYLSRAAAALVLISPPMVRCIRNGQVSAVLAAILIWACGTANRIAAGVGFGVIASIKPQLVILAPLMHVLNRDWRAFLSTGVTFLSIVLLSVALFGPERWPEWVASMDSFHSAVTDTNVIRVSASPAAVAERFGLWPLPFMLLGATIGAVAVYLCRGGGPLEKATAIGMGSIMASPYALAYDLVIITPFLAALLMRGRILALAGIAATAHPLPLLVTLFELARGKWPKRRENVNPSFAETRH